MATGNDLLKALLAKRAEQQAQLSAAIRPYSEAIALLDGQVETLTQEHMATVTGLKLGAPVTLRDGRKAVITSFVNFLLLPQRNRLPAKEEIGVRMNILKADGRPGKFGLIRSATDFVTDGTILIA